MLRKYLLFLLLLFVSVPTFLHQSDNPVVVAAAETAVWQSTPSPTGGSVAAVAISPDFAQDQTAYAAVRGRGVYRSEDGGFHWQPAGPDGWYINDLVLSPDFPNDQTLFATTGLQTVTTTVQRSTDGGLTWQPATFAESVLNGRSLVISPNFASDQTLYLVTNAFAHVSTDGGVNFAPATGWFSTHSVDALAMATDQILFAAAADGSEEGIFRSENGGTNWTLMRSGVFTAVATSPDYTTDNLVLALDSAGQLHRSDDGGTTWTTPALTISGSKHTIAFSPTFVFDANDQTDSRIMVAGSYDDGPYLSDDGGLTWSASGWYDPADTFENGLIGGTVHDLALAPNQDWAGTVLAATSVGVARSAYGGTSWRQANEGLPNLTVRTLAAAPNAPDTLLAGTTYFENLIVTTSNPGEYDGNLQLSTNGGQTWQVVSEKLRAVTAVTFSPNFASDATAFAAAGTIGQHGFYSGGVYRSTDGGENWTQVFGNQAIFGLAVSPNFAIDQTVWATAWTYTGSVGVYRSTNGGASWSPIAPGVAAYDLIVSPNYASDQTVFATTSNGLQKSTDGGGSWNPVGPAESITGVAVSPLYGASQTILVTTVDALHRSTDGGTSWETLDVGLPATQEGEPLILNEVSFALDGSLLVAGYYENLAGSTFVRRSSDAGATWNTIGTDLGGEFAHDFLTRPANSFLLTAVTNTGLQQIAIAQGTVAEPGSWSSSGPRGGRALALVVSPDFANDGIAFGGEWMANFQGSAVGLGPHKSSDFGQTWQASPSNAPYSNPVLDYAFSPNFATDDTMFAATWGDVLKSSNEGETWQATGAMNGSVPGFFYRVAAAPDFASSGLVLAGTNYYSEQLYVSRDSGVTWENPQAVSAAGGIAFSPNFATDQTVFAAGAEGVSKSEDTAVSFTPVLTTVVRSLAISPNFASDQTLFAGEANVPDTAVFYRSENGGSSWITRTIAADVNFINALAVSPAFASDQTLFAGTDAGLFLSEDGGDSWTLVDAYENQNILSLALSPGWPSHAVLLVGLDSGVFRLLSANPATGTLRQPSDHFAALPTNPLALSPDGLLLTAGPHRSVFASEDGGASWQSLGLGGGYYGFTEVAASPAYASDQTLFAARSRLDGIGSTLYRSQNGGQTWTGVLNSDLVTDIAISPSFGADQTMFAATNEDALQVSTDGGDTWNDVGTWPVSPGGAALQVALPPTYPADGPIFAGGAKGFWRLLPGETMWQTAVSGLTDSHRILTIAVSSNYASDQTLLVLASWSNPPDYLIHYGVFSSQDGGASWTQEGTGLPDEPLAGLALSPTLGGDGLAYVTTRGGDLYRSRDTGLTWTLVGSAPERPSFADVVVDQNGTVFVASDVGVWRYETSQFDIMINGGFETEEVWDLPGTSLPAQYGDTILYDGQQAMQTGSFGNDNVVAYSSARQDVTIPAGTQTATLSFYTYAVSGGGAMAGKTAVFPQNSITSIAEPTVTTGGDSQYAFILDPDTDAMLQTLFWEQSNSQMWQSRT
ncbi:MAG: hypothetical protein CL608_01965, partial [Anaerolineaceae bacterium]|nr:hypothetical protein [Anaerolineaceae bacterium]